MPRQIERIAHEYLLISQAFQNELAAIGTDEYSRYHQQNADWYRSFSDRLNDILGFKGYYNDEFLEHMSSIQLSNEQKQELAKLRREPMFKRLMGETALQQKKELETILGGRITSEGMTFADENGATVAVKTEQQLEQELDTYNEQLSKLLSYGALTDGQYNYYNQNLEHIYDYYISRSKGEQLPFRKMTDAQYAQIEQEAQANGIRFEEQMYQATQDLKDDFDEVQELQSNGTKNTHL